MHGQMHGAFVPKRFGELRRLVDTVVAPSHLCAGWPIVRKTLSGWRLVHEVGRYFSCLLRQHAVDHQFHIFCPDRHADDPPFQIARLGDGVARR